MEKYSTEQLQTALNSPDATGWQLDAGNGPIFKVFTFQNFPGAIGFVNQVASIAEELGHHPEITITYNRVKLSLTTHDAGGLTALDFELARRANRLQPA